MFETNRESKAEGSKKKQKKVKEMEKILEKNKFFSDGNVEFEFSQRKESCAGSGKVRYVVFLSL